MECNICKEEAVNPIKCDKCVCVCCKDCIEAWLYIDNTCPLCRDIKDTIDIPITLSIAENIRRDRNFLNNLESREIELREIRRRRTRIESLRTQSLRTRWNNLLNLRN